MNRQRGTHGGYLLYDWISIPLVYTQLVALAVWIHFAICLFGYQWVDNTKNPLLQGKDPDLDLYLPIFTFWEFVCYVGWLRVAQGMLNPLGEDDNDIELNAIIDGNLRKGFLMADDLYGKMPKLGEDGFDDIPELPHTVASLPFAAQEGMVHSAASVEIPEQKTSVMIRANSQVFILCCKMDVE